MEQERKDIVKLVALGIVLFAICSIFGWVYETIDNVFQFGGLWLRAALVLPWCPIYGIGALILLVVMKFVANKLETINAHKVVIFIVMFVVAYVMSLLVELAGSYVCEFCFGVVPWDYSHAPFNFDGRVAPMYTIRFALFGLLAYYVVDPLTRKWASKHPKGLRAAAALIIVLMGLDIAGELAGLWDTLEDGLAAYGVHHW